MQSLLLILVSFSAGAERSIASLSLVLDQEAFFYPKAMLMSI